MIKINNILSLLILCLITSTVQAQDRLTDEQKVAFQNRVKQKVDEFQYALSDIVNEKLDHTIRKAQVKNLLQLFMGEGDPYDYYDEELDKRIHSTGVKMQTSSVNQVSNQSQKLKRYIYRLYNPETRKTSLSYSKIVIESASAVRVDNIERVGDHYECVAYFTQKFIGYRDGIPYYSDITAKKIRCFINNIDLPTGKKIFEAKLGDIYVLSTQRL